MKIKEMKVLSEWSYEPAKIQRGYANNTLYVGLGNKDGKYKFEKRPVSEDMKDKFTGGRGFGLKLLWDAVNEETKWDDPENELVIAGGPFCGITQYPEPESHTLYSFLLQQNRHITATPGDISAHSLSSRDLMPLRSREKQRNL